MPQFDVTVPHTLSKQEAHERLKGFSDKVREHYTDMVKDVHQEWRGETLHFGFKTLGVRIDGDLSVTDDAVRVKGDLVIEQMVADAIGLVGGVQGGAHVALAPGESALFDAADGRDITGGVQADQVQGIA